MSTDHNSEDTGASAYQVAPEQPGHEQGYDVATPDQADEGYTDADVLRRRSGSHQTDSGEDG